jgi:hypothetical protein
MAPGFHEHCNVHNADCGFAAAKKGGIVTSRPTSGDLGHCLRECCVHGLEPLFGEAGRIMSSYLCGCNENDRSLASSLDRHVLLRKQMLCPVGTELSAENVVLVCGQVVA